MAQDQYVTPVPSQDDEDQLRQLLGLPPDVPLPLMAPAAAAATSAAAKPDSSDSAAKDDDKKSADSGAVPAPLPGIAKPSSVAFGTGSPLGKIPIYGDETAPAAPDQVKTFAPSGGATLPAVQLSPAVQKAQQALATISATPSGVAQKHGFGGGLLKALDIAGTIVAPHVLAAIPGTTLNHAVQVNQAQGALNNATRQQQAQTNLLKDQVDVQSKLNPPAKDATPEQQAFDDLTNQTNPQTGKNYTPTEAFQKVNEIKENAKPQPVKEGELPLGKSGVDQMNGAFLTRYQIMHPGAAELPPTYKLPDNATQKDFDRLDKVLSSTENAYGNKQQRDRAFTEAQTQHEFMRTIAQQNQESRGDKDDMQVVVGNDANGNRVLASAGDAKKLGLSGVTKADADLQNKTEAARHWINLADKKGDTPETMGIMQLIDKMDKEGKLGVVASRWNDFLAGKVGDGDQEFTALRAKMGLANTKLMQAHVGSRGGAFMLEHFEDLANAKKMNAQTLRSGVGSELDYMKDVAMLPQNQAGKSSSGSTQTAAPSGVPAGATHVYRDKNQQVVGYALNGQYHALNQ